MNSFRRNYYEILDVTPTASQDEIRRRYRELAKQYHPDANQAQGIEWAHQKMAELNEAYDVLKDPARRAQYDLLQQIFAPPPTVPPPEAWPTGQPSTAPSEDELLPLYQRGLQLEREERWAESLAVFTRIQAIDAHYRDIQGRIDRARSMLVEQETASDLARRYVEANEYIVTRQWAAAVAVLDELVARDPDYRDAADKLLMARRQLRQQRLYTDALAFMNEEKWLEAIVHFEALLAEVPDYADAAEQLQIAQDQYRRTREQALVAAAEEDDPEAADEALLRDITKPMPPVTDTVEVSPPEEAPPADADPDRLVAAGFRAFERRQLAEAGRLFSTALQIDQRYADAYAGLGWIYARTRQLESALENLEAALHIDGTCVRAYIGMGQVYEQQGGYLEAITAFRQAAQLAPSADLHGRLARLYIVEGRLAEAANAYRAWISMEPEPASTAQPYYRLARLLAVQNNLREAIEAYKQVSRLAPRFARPHAMLGALHEALGQREAAQEAYRHFLQLSHSPSERRHRRRVVWRLYFSRLMPHGHWLLGIGVWLPILLAALFVGFNWAAWAGIALGMGLGLWFVRKPGSTPLTPLGRYSRYSFYNGGGVLLGLLSALLQFAAMSSETNNAALSLVLVAMVALLLALHLAMTYTRPGYQLVAGFAGGLIVGGLVALSVQMEAANLVLGFAWAALYLVVGGLAVAIAAWIWLGVLGVLAESFAQRQRQG